jgi:spore coat polysaccharide biosynthesis predicted glycosyltransferase SpsG
MRTVFFRTDYNNKIGFGHFSRCISIAEIIEKKFKIFFVLNKNDSSQDIRKFYKYEFIFIEHEFEFFNLLRPENIVVFDSYEFNENIQSEINKKNVKLIVIDDLNSMVYNCNAIINHGVLYKKEDYITNPKTKFYLGLDYLMVRKEFRKISRSKAIKITQKNLKSVFISFGGSNQIELINKTIKILIKNEIYIFNILIDENLVNNITNENAQINTYSNLNPSKIIEVIRNSDFAILPASTILLEAFTIGIPVISGWFVENQKFSLSEFEKMGLILNIDQFNSENYNIKLTNALYLLKNKKDLVQNQKNKIKLKEQNYLNIFNEFEK